jgi:periplasmic divalent cation tolerance protein
MAKSKYATIFITVPNRKEAENIAKKLLEEKLVACVNIVPGISSYYWWKGKIEFSKELLLIIKTERQRMSKIISKVKSLHSYTVPEIILLPIIDGNKDYLNWITDSISNK